MVNFVPPETCQIRLCLSVLIVNVYCCFSLFFDFLGASLPPAVQQCNNLGIHTQPSLLTSKL